MSQSQPKITVRESALLGLVAVVVHLLFLAALPEEWRGNNSYDYQRFYEPVATRLVEGHGITTTEGALATRYPPGFPSILAGLFSVSDATGISRPAALDIFVALTVWLNVLLASRVSNRFFAKRVSILACLVLATYPFYLWLTKQPNSENAFIGPFLLSVLFLDRSVVQLSEGKPFLRDMIVCGILCGLMSLIRPISIVIAVVYLGILFLKGWPRNPRATLGAALALVLANALAVLPWEITAYQETGRVIPLSTGGAPSIVDGLTFTEIPSLEQNTPWVPGDVDAVIQRIHVQRDSLESSGQVMEVAWEELSTEPVAFLKLMLIKMVRSWYATNMAWHESSTALIQLPYVLLAMFGLLILRRSGQRGADFVGLSLGLLVYYWAMTVLALSILRYMIPVMILLMPAVATTLLTAFDRLRGQRKSMIVAEVGAKPSISNHS